MRLRWGYLRGLVTLDLNGCLAGISLSLLTHCSQLESVKLRGTYRILGSTYFASWPVITSLDIQVSDIQCLRSCKTLTRLRLEGSPATPDFCPIAQCTLLRHLDIDGCTSVCDITPLGMCTSLTYLRLFRLSDIDGLEPLAACTSLSKLDVSLCSRITRVHALRSCPLLKTLNLTHMESLSDVGALADCASLTSLGITGCRSLEDICPLAACTSLTCLRLGGCQSLLRAKCVQVKYAGRVRQLGSHNIDNKDGLAPIRHFLPHVLIRG